MIFAVAFTAFFLGMLIYTLVTHYKFNLESSLVIAFFVVGCCVLLGFGIYGQIKYNKTNAAERKLLKDCLCTDGIVKWCKSSRVETHGGESYYYKVTVCYRFCNDKNAIKQSTYTNNYDYDPEFYTGQHLIIAFNETDSAILGKFSFVKEDEERFLKNEAARSADDFDNLNGKLLNVDPTRKIQSAELEYAWFWAAFGLFIFFVGYTVPISIFATPKLVMGRIMPDIIIIPLLYFPSLLFISVVTGFWVVYVKKRRYFKKILNNKPYFTWGKIFASEKTYRRYISKHVYYCYIDKDGNRHTELFSGHAVRKAIEGKPVDVAVMYDDKGNSLPLYNYKFTDEI
ncbi:MAG: hypothetical protein K2G38_03270 [Clostridia bacterium]|nr:hypothetical protein [Clostridia bacterium]